MNRTLLLGPLTLAVACAAKTPPATTPARQDVQAAADPKTAPPPDPTLDARKAFANPGGMWMPSQMALPQHAELLRAMGVTVPAENLTNPLSAPLNAVVSLGGCTASFVSAEGLVITNHHCVQSALQLNATPESNLVERGFLAKERGQELPAGPAQKVSVAQAITDVTDQVTKDLAAIKDPVKRKLEIDKRTKQVTAACEKDRPGLRCDVVSFFRGAMYQCIEYLEIRDVRLVYAPPRSIGNYGGEVDNWAWPRHTGDWSFFRAYVGKDGLPADPSPDNVPFRPKHFLKLDRDGVREHDFVMVAGYPGRTNRITTFAEVQHDVDAYYPAVIDTYSARYALLEKMLAADSGASPDTRIKAGVQKQRIQNGLEKTTGVLAGLQKGDMLAQKKSVDDRVRAWSREPGNEAYVKAIASLDAFVATRQKTFAEDFVRTQTLAGSGHLTNALLLVRLADERQKPDAERRPGSQERDMPRIESQQKQFARTFDAGIDRALFRLALVRALALPEKDRPWLATIVGSKKVDEAAIDKALEGLYAKTQLADEALRLDLLKNATLPKLRASKDPFIKLAVSLWPTVKANEKKDDQRLGEAILLMPRYAEAMQRALAGFVAPDANSTLRITYGTIRPFEPGQRPFTTVDEIPAKDKGQAPFDAPAAELSAIQQKRFGSYADPSLGSVPVDFIADLDITGGNSGSAALDAEGELIGLAFDGNIEGVASDVVFNHATTRAIMVDTRYMTWVMDLLDGADNLLQELGIPPSL